MYNKICTGIRNVAEWIVLVSALIIFAFVAVTTLLYRFDGVDSIPYQDNIFLELVTLIGGCLLVVILGKILRPLHDRWPHVDKLFFVVTLVWVCGFCYTYLVGAKTLPGSDSKSVYDIAVRMYNGDMGAVVPKGSYLSLWPFQTGLVFIFEKLMRIFNTTEPFMLQCWNIFYIGLAVTSVYGLVCAMTKRLEARLGGILLAGMNFPLMLSVTAAYGDVPAVGLMMFSAWMFLLFERGEGKLHLLYGLCGAGAIILACTYRRNCLIFVIALALLAVVRLLSKFKWDLLIVMLLTVVLSVSSTTITQKYYEAYAQNVCGKGVPTVAYLAMGMQQGVAAPGFWNGYHANLYIQTDYSYEETARISKESIAQSWAGFMANPAYMLDFYYQKQVCQWADATHGSFHGQDDLYESDRSEFALNILYEDTHDILIEVMNQYEAMVTVLAVAGIGVLIYGKKKTGKLDLFACITIVSLVGTFMFTIIWEGGPRYTLPAPFLMLPVAASVFPVIADGCERLLAKVGDLQKK